MTGTTNLTLWLGQDQYAEANNDLTGMIALIEEANQISKEWAATDPEMGDRNMPTVAIHAELENGNNELLWMYDPSVKSGKQIWMKGELVNYANSFVWPRLR